MKGVPGMFERYTEKSRRVIFFARYEASQFGSPCIETEHLLLGLLREDKALTNRFLRSHASVESIRKEIEGHTTIREKVSTSVDLPISNEGKRVLAYAAEEAERLGHKHIGTEHLLLGLLREPECFVAELLKERGVELDKVREELTRVPHPVPTVTPGPGASGATAAIELSRDLTHAAVNGELDSVIGRERELDGVIEVLGNRHCANPLLVGERGTGRTAIVEALAQRIAEGTVPPFLAEVRVFDLQAALGASRIPQFQELLKATQKTNTETLGVILYIGELRALLRPAVELEVRGATGILRHSPREGTVRCIAAATPSDYQECVRLAPWIESSFRAVHVHPLSPEDTLKVLEARKAAYETFHEVSYADEALQCVAQLGEQYLAGSSLPGKALQLLDAAGARVKLRQGPVPAEIAEAQKRVRFIAMRLEGAMLNHEFEKARFYSDEERKERENLRILREKYPATAQQSRVVSREDVEAAIARSAEYPFQP
jgi:ATP-dependent Clp protease ATP-binding subunit ClpC